VESKANKETTEPRVPIGNNKMEYHINLEINNPLLCGAGMLLYIKRMYKMGKSK
jgi:hypothetical protein